MNIKEGKANLFLGIFFVILGAVLLAVIIPSQIAYVKDAFPQPRFFPNVISGLMVILGIALAVSGYRTMKADKEGQEVYTFIPHEVKLVVITLIIIFAYVLLLNWLPYLPCTIVTLAILITLYGQKKIWKIALTAVLVSVIIYVGMKYGLSVRLP